MASCCPRTSCSPSRSSARRNARDDRIVKPAQLAAAGVPHFWLVDPAGGPAVHVHRLAGSVYKQTHLGRSEDVVDLHEPFPVTLVLSRLLPPQP